MYDSDLAGNWMLTERRTQKKYPGHLPGSNYIDLLNSGAIDDPFWGLNENEARKIAEEEYSYSRHFTVNNELLENDRVVLEIAGLDTFAIVKLNGQEIGRGNNAHREYRFEIKPYLLIGTNDIEIEFASPIPYIRTMRRKQPLFHMSFGEIPSYVRKPHYHFGWDWGPCLPPVGISGRIGIRGEKHARLEWVKVKQLHEGGKVALHITGSVEQLGKSQDSRACRIKLVSPSGTAQETVCIPTEGRLEAELIVDDPQLWWSNGLGEQPLYEVEVCLYAKGVGEPLDLWRRQIGLRTIRLDTSEDKHGGNFRFIVNDVPIFAKGANWIPSDSFVTRTTEADLEFYIRSAKEANMNMLRVWGGGYYESDAFYELCDRYGLLVWQDFGFACNEYPLSDAQFMDNVRSEVEDQVRRLCHHASLALWCGNNEVEPFYLLMKRKSVTAHKRFFFEQLPAWIAEHDETTPYWPGSPSSGGPQAKASLLHKGDSHLWQVWHGMKPIEYLGEMPARFCSEFGLESMPGLPTIRSFTDAPQISISDPEMKAHQKSQAGNEKMLFYILSKYRNPASFEDFIYLSQLIQAEAVQAATEGWRRKTGRCNGALYWQYNDCWPTASWSGVDYEKRFKALQYKARHFNNMLCVSAHMRKDGAEVYAINDYATPFRGTLRWKLADFEGGIIASSELAVLVGPTEAALVSSLDFGRIIGSRRQNDLALTLILTNEDGVIVSEQNKLLVPDKKALLRKPNIRHELALADGTATLTLVSDTYARYVRIEIDGVNARFSDNYFDLESGKSVTVTFVPEEGMDAASLARRIRILSLADVNYKGSPIGDKARRLLFRLRPINFFTWMIYKFV